MLIYLGRLHRWEFYFAYCEAAFDCGYIQDYQIIWQGSPSPSLGSQHRSSSASSPQKLKALMRSSSKCNVDGTVLKSYPSDGIVTWALFGVYCVLAGIVIARQPYMLVAALAFGLGQAFSHVRSSAVWWLALFVST
jgi:hypothetical protein